MADRLGDLLSEIADVDLGPGPLQRPSVERPAPDPDPLPSGPRGASWLVSAAALLAVLLLVAVVALRSDGSGVQIETPGTEPELPPPATTEVDPRPVATAAERTMESPWRGSWYTGLGNADPQRITYVPASGYRFDGDGPASSSTIVTSTGRFTGMGSIRYGEWHFDPEWVTERDPLDPAYLLPLLLEQLTDPGLSDGAGSDGAKPVVGMLDAATCQAFNWEPVTSPCLMEIELSDDRVSSVEVRRTTSEPGTGQLLVRLEVGQLEPDLTIEEPPPSGNWPGIGGPVAVGDYATGARPIDIPGLPQALDAFGVSFDNEPLALPGDQCWVDIPSKGELGACFEPSPDGGFVITRLVYFAQGRPDRDLPLAENGTGYSSQGATVEVFCRNGPGAFAVRFGDEEEYSGVEEGNGTCAVEMDRAADQAGWVVLRLSPTDSGPPGEVQAFSIPPSDSSAG
jgi:hypothetical protein